MKNLFAMALLVWTSAATAQAPATAPQGATGICKDGTYSSAPKKDGACRGHKGIQTWYSATVPSLPAPSPGTTSSLNSPKPAPSSKALPAPTPGSSPSLPAPARTAATPSLPAPAKAAAAPSLPAPAPAQKMPSEPAPTPAAASPSMPAPSPGIAAQRARSASAPAAPGGGPGLVWVNTASKVYHCPGSDFYGKTKAGTYLTEAAAKAEGDRPNRNKPCN